MESTHVPILPESLVDAGDVAAALGVSTRLVLMESFQQRLGITPHRFGRKCVRFSPSQIRAAVARAAGENGDN